MGSPVSPIVADIYMEDFEDKALLSAPNPPKLWLRYVDDTFVLLHEYDVDNFTRHINSLDPHIQFTMEPEQGGSLPFLDLSIHVLDDGSTKITIYRKPTHTDQYLNFRSNHPIQHKQSVVRILFNRADNYVTTEEDRNAERRHVRRALRANNYTPWAMKIRPRQAPTSEAHLDTGARPTVAIPYISGLSEELARTYKNYGVNSYMKPINTIRQQLVRPKDATPLECQSCVIYQLQCNEQRSHSYIGETKLALHPSHRTPEERQTHSCG